MSAVTRPADPTGAPAAPAAGTTDADVGLPLVVIDVERAVGRYLELRAAFPWVDVHYDVSALSHPALLDAIAATRGGFAVAGRPAVDAVIRREAHPRLLHTGPLDPPEELAAAWAAGVRRVVAADPAGLDAVAGAPGDARVLLRLRPVGDEPAADGPGTGFRARDVVPAVRAAAERGVCVGGLSLQPPAHSSPAGYVAEIAHAAAVAADVRATTGVRFDLLDLGAGFPGRAASRPAEAAELARAIRAIVAPATSRVTVIASASRAVTAGCLSIVTGADAREVEPAAASACIDAGADVRVLGRDLRPRLLGRLSFFRGGAERGHRVLRPRRARATWSPAG